MEYWRLIPIQTNNGYWNMALDEAILKEVINKHSKLTLRFYKWYPSTISIGRNQSLKDEVDVKVSMEKGFNVVRRITGGGAVFHDSDREITYSIVSPIKFLEKLNAKKVLEQFELITKGIIAGLRIYGLKAKKGIIHCPALFLEGKKFSGNAQVRKRGYILQHGTILLDLDADLMYSVLKTPHNVGKSRMVRSVYAKCIGIKDVIENYDETKLIDSLKKGFEETLNIEFNEQDFSQQELKIAEGLVKERYRNEKWLKKYE